MEATQPQNANANQTQPQPCATLIQHIDPLRVHCVTISPNGMIFAATDEGLYIMLADGKCWEQLTTKAVANL